MANKTFEQRMREAFGGNEAEGIRRKILMSPRDIDAELDAEILAEARGNGSITEEEYNSRLETLRASYQEADQFYRQDEEFRAQAKEASKAMDRLGMEIQSAQESGSYEDLAAAYQEAEKTLGKMDPGIPGIWQDLQEIRGRRKDAVSQIRRQDVMGDVYSRWRLDYTTASMQRDPEARERKFQEAVARNSAILEEQGISVDEFNEFSAGKGGPKAYPLPDLAQAPTTKEIAGPKAPPVEAPKPEIQPQDPGLPNRKQTLQNIRANFGDVQLDPANARRADAMIRDFMGGGKDYLVPAIQKIFQDSKGAQQAPSPSIRQEAISSLGEILGRV